MGKYKLNNKADREKLIRAFDKYLPKVGTNVEYGEAYGYVFFQLYQAQKAARRPSRLPSSND